MKTALAALYALAAPLAAASAPPLPIGPAAPALPADARAWVGAPQSWAKLRGQVVLLDVWAFGCVNCVNTIPWMKAAHARYSERGVAFVGIHTPEFGFEKQRPAFLAELKTHGLRYPQLMDNDMAYWEALGAQYWPTTYLVDRCGRLRGRHIGEVRDGEFSGDAVDAMLEALLAEPATCPSLP
jgi:hypothetical protein